MFQSEELARDEPLVWSLGRAPKCGICSARARQAISNVCGHYDRPLSILWSATRLDVWRHTAYLELSTSRTKPSALCS